MKKRLVGIAAVVLVMFLGVSSVWAAGPGQGQGRNGVCGSGVYCQNYAGDHFYSYGRGKNFTDADNDGICDNCAMRICLQDGTGCRNGFRGGRHR